MRARITFIAPFVAVFALTAASVQSGYSGTGGDATGTAAGVPEPTASGVPL